MNKEKLLKDIKDYFTLCKQEKIMPKEEYLVQIIKTNYKQYRWLE